MSGGLDERLARELVARGVVSHEAVLHARDMRLRGFASAPLGDLLIELEHVESGDLTAALSAITGAPTWDGKGFDVELAGALGLRRPGAIAVRQDALTVWFATTEPHDETLREDVRFAAGSRRADPLVARPEVIAWALGRARPFDDAELRALVHEAASVSLPDAEPRARWASSNGADTPPEVRLANRVLLRLAAGPPGASARVEAFDEPAVRWGACGAFDDAWVPTFDPVRARAALALVIHRLVHMADLSPDQRPAAGWFHLRARRREWSFELLVEPTSRGEAATIVRRVPWLGSHPPEGDEWAEVQERGAAAQRLDAAGQRRERVAAMRELVRAIARLGRGALLERVRAQWDLACSLDADGEQTEARPIAEEALGLVLEHGLGTRAEGDLRSCIALMEVNHPELRGAALEQAEALLGAGGVGRRPVAGLALERATAARLAAKPDDTVRAAEVAIADAKRWFGAPTATAVAACVEAAIAHAELGQAGAALARAKEAVEASSIHPALPIAAGWALARAELVTGSSEEPLERLRTVSARARAELGSAERIWIEADLARALDARGRTAEARSIATRALDETPAGDPFCASPRSWLAALLRRAGPYR